MHLSQESVAAGSQHVAMSLQLVVDSYQHVAGGDVSVWGYISAVDDDHMSVCVYIHTVLHRLYHSVI